MADSAITPGRTREHVSRLDTADLPRAPRPPSRRVRYVLRRNRGFSD
jgi:hypothetical protein